MNYTDEDIRNLIECPKQIVEKARKWMKVEGKHRRNDFKLKSVDEKYEFNVFVRQHILFEENFSIGLSYGPKDEAKKFNLIRFNGKHGGHETLPHHAYFHIHRITAEDINNNIDIERRVETTKEYASFNEALEYFCKILNIQNAEDYFPNRTQGAFNFIIGDQDESH